MMNMATGLKLDSQARSQLSREELESLPYEELKKHLDSIESYLGTIYSVMDDRKQ